MERFKSVVCADLCIFNKSNEILLMKRCNTGYDDGFYELPGGHLESNEDIFDCMIRETKEELDIDLERNDLEIIHLMHHYTGTRLNFIFKTNKYVEPKINEPNKCSELIWVNIDNIPTNATDKVKIILENIKNNTFYDKM